MTKEEVRNYLQTYCGVDLREEDCTLENVLNLIPNVEDAEQREAFTLDVPLSEHYFDPFVNMNYLYGDLIISRNNDGLWTLDWDCWGITGMLPQGKDLMTAALYMCEFCAVNGISLNTKNINNSDN